MESGAFDADRNVTQPAGRGGISKEVVAEERMEIEEGVAVEADFVDRADQELDRILVVGMICASSGARPTASSPSSMRRLVSSSEYVLPSRRLEFQARSIYSLLRICLA